MARHPRGEAVTDEQLVARHLRGDRDAFAELIVRYSGRLFNLAYRFIGDQAEAEDVAQEAFLRAYTALPRSRAELPFKPWLFQIAVNLCRDWARRTRPVPFSDLPGSAEGEDAPEAAALGLDALADPEPLPSEAAEAHEQAAALRQAVMALPPAFRLIVTLRYNEGLSYEEIGRLLNMPPVTVGTSLLRAHRRLRAALTETGEATDDRTS